jgi:hypothetical protein
VYDYYHSTQRLIKIASIALLLGLITGLLLWKIPNRQSLLHNSNGLCFSLYFVLLFRSFQISFVIHVIKQNVE